MARSNTTLLWGTCTGNNDRGNFLLHPVSRQFGPLVKETIGSKTVVHVFCPEDIKTVYRWVIKLV